MMKFPESEKLLKKFLKNRKINKSYKTTKGKNFGNYKYIYKTYYLKKSMYLSF